jgi:hypothetical protein
MIKLKIRNMFNDEHLNPELIKPYDKSKWADGLEFEFSTLFDIACFINTCDIDFTDEAKSTFNDYSWEVLDKTHFIADDEENTIIFEIGAHPEWID